MKEKADIECHSFVLFTYLNISFVGLLKSFLLMQVNMTINSLLSSVCFFYLMLSLFLHLYLQYTAVKGLTAEYLD